MRAMVVRIAVGLFYVGKGLLVVAHVLFSSVYQSLQGVGRGLKDDLRALRERGTNFE
jgi:hypothetical protein